MSTFMLLSCIVTLFFVLYITLVGTGTTLDDFGPGGAVTVEHGLSLVLLNLRASLELETWGWVNLIRSGKRNRRFALYAKYHSRVGKGPWEE
jgi:hypothetical protein